MHVVVLKIVVELVASLSLHYCSACSVLLILRCHLIDCACFHSTVDKSKATVISIKNYVMLFT